jgi:hypothetical protein
LGKLTALSFFRIESCAIPELYRTGVLGVPPNYMLHILSRETHRLPCCHATNDNMDVRVFRISVNHRRPFQRSAHVALDRLHNVSREPF